MLAIAIVFEAPLLDLLTRIVHGQAPMQVQALITETAVERFDIRIIRGFAWS